MLVKWVFACLLTLGIIVGFLLGPYLHNSLGRHSNVRINVVGSKKHAVFGDMKQLRIPEFKEGTLSSVFVADLAETMDFEHIKFTNPKLIRYKEATKEIRSMMTADTAIMKLTKPGSLSMEYDNMKWFGNFQYKQYGEEDER